MPISLKEYAQRLETALTPPAGIQIAIDAHTDNIIVQNDERGFVITRVCLDNWAFDRVTGDARIALDALIAGKDECSVCKIYRRDDLWCPDRLRDRTLFDDGNR